VNPLDIIRGRDGSIALTKLVAATFHLMLAVTVGWVTYVKQDFIESMWLLYAGVAVGHAVIDKGGAQIAAFKNRQLRREDHDHDEHPRDGEDRRW
jgi:hypothetical protein